MPDVIGTAREDDLRRRAEVQQYQVQQQLDEVRRQLREVVARQQWLEDQYKQGEGRVAQFQINQDQFAQSITQALNARQIDDQRVKQQLAELATRGDEPMKLLREMRGQITDLTESRRTDRDRFAAELRQFDGIQSQLRELVAQIGLLADGQRQLRDQVQELDGVNEATRQEITRLGELQRMEEQRLRRQGAELQEMVEGLRVQFQDIVARSQRIEEIRRQMTERTEAVETLVSTLKQEDQRLDVGLQRLDKVIGENHHLVQDRVEALRGGFEAAIGEVRQVNDQRVDRSQGRFQTMEDRLRDLEQRLIELPPALDRLHLQALESRAEHEAIEEWHLRREIEALEAQLDELRARRTAQQVEVARPEAPGLIRSVREARPPGRPDDAPPPGGGR